ncbi:hypothetical protein H696_02184 [Fonticula alba]|uniref:Uncharacterized protein n=1 Tax=Fonticula alba TaxID=691883 RepID=A0A058ZA96_FONAL|nr:hypothetical protein H696_02184 [Fonticula alba]KCV71234.1 hypothetical protein H696_02184 [Fonticula alba]|eukprot:XP_009494357.1 hypothetical protein H696_02184 [Fonticula alba]
MLQWAAVARCPAGILRPSPGRRLSAAATAATRLPELGLAQPGLGLPGPPDPGAQVPVSPHPGPASDEDTGLGSRLSVLRLYIPHRAVGADRLELLASGDDAALVAAAAATAAAATVRRPDQVRETEALRRLAAGAGRPILGPGPPGLAACVDGGHGGTTGDGHASRRLELSQSAQALLGVRAARRPPVEEPSTVAPQPARLLPATLARYQAILALVEASPGATSATIAAQLGLTVQQVTRAVRALRPGYAWPKRQRSLRRQEQVAQLLQEEPGITVTRAAQRLGMDPKSVYALAEATIPGHVWHRAERLAPGAADRALVLLERRVAASPLDRQSLGAIAQEAGLSVPALRRLAAARVPEALTPPRKPRAAPAPPAADSLPANASSTGVLDRAAATPVGISPTGGASPPGEIAGASPPAGAYGDGGSPGPRSARQQAIVQLARQRPDFTPTAIARQVGVALNTVRSTLALFMPGRQVVSPPTRTSLPREELRARVLSLSGALSRTEIAQMLGVSPRTVGRILQHQRRLALGDGARPKPAPRGPPLPLSSSRLASGLHRQTPSPGSDQLAHLLRVAQVPPALCLTQTPFRLVDGQTTDQR